MKNYIFTAILVFISILAHSQYKDWCSSEIFLKDGTKLSGKARLTMIESKFGFPIPIVSEEYLRYINFKIKQKSNYSAFNIAIVLKASNTFCPFLMQVSVTERMTA